MWAPKREPQVSGARAGEWAWPVVERAHDAERSREGADRERLSGQTACRDRALVLSCAALRATTAPLLPTDLPSSLPRRVEGCHVFHPAVPNVAG